MYSDKKVHAIFVSGLKKKQLDRLDQLKQDIEALIVFKTDLRWQTIELKIENIAVKPIAVNDAFSFKKNRINEGSKHNYKCFDYLEFLDRRGLGRNCLVKINGNEVRIAYNQIIVLMFLAMELKKNEGGWVSRDSLIEKFMTTDECDTQRTISNLRKDIRNCLKKQNEKNFIENDHRGK